MPIKNTLQLLALLWGTTGMAQMRFGVTGGGAFSSASIIPVVKFGAAGVPDFITHRKSIFSYHAGIAMTYPLGRSLHLKGDILYSQKGWYLDYRFLTATGTSTYRYNTTDKEKFTLSYLELPVLLVYSVPAGRGKGVIGGGGYAGYVLDTKQEQVGGDDRFPFLKESAALDTNHHKIDYGLALSMGYEYGFGLFINIMVQYGLQDVYQRDLEDDFLARNYKTQHRQLRLSVGYMFKKKRKAK